MRHRLALQGKKKFQKRIQETPWITTRTELMTMATDVFHASHIADDEAAPLVHARAPSGRASFMRRFYDALIETQARRARIEIDRKLGAGAFERARRMQLPPEV
jgi:hypothetical protein